MDCKFLAAIPQVDITMQHVDIRILLPRRPVTTLLEYYFCDYR